MVFQVDASDPLVIFGALAVLIFLGFIGNLIFSRLRFNDTLILILVGVVVGPVLALVDREAMLELSGIIGPLALILILFDGGLALRLRDLMHGLGSAAVLGVFGFVITTTVVGGLTALTLDVPFTTGMILGSILGGTSALVVLPSLEHLEVDKRTGTTLGLESALTDVLVVVVSFTLIAIVAASVATDPAASTQDEDLDGLADGWERTHFGNLGQDGDDDPDGDGRENIREFRDETDPNEPDTGPPDEDGDGMPDPWEEEHFGNTGQPASADPDRDNRTNLEEYFDGTDPTSPDEPGGIEGEGGGAVALDAQGITSKLLITFAMSIFMGLAAGLLWLLLYPKVREKPFGYMLTLGFMFAMYVFVEWVLQDVSNGGGPLAVLAFGIVLGNNQSLGAIGRRVGDAFGTGMKRFQGEISFLVRTFFFIFLGIIVDIDILTDWRIIGISVLLLVGMVAARYVAVAATCRQLVPRGDNLVMLVMMPRGLASAVLAALPASVAIPDSDRTGIPGTESFVALAFLLLLWTNLVASIGGLMLEHKGGTGPAGKGSAGKGTAGQGGKGTANRGGQGAKTRKAGGKKKQAGKPGAGVGGKAKAAGRGAAKAKRGPVRGTKGGRIPTPSTTQAAFEDRGRSG